MAIPSIVNQDQPKQYWPIFWLTVHKMSSFKTVTCYEFSELGGGWCKPKFPEGGKKSHTYIDDFIRLIDQLELHDHGEISATDLESRGLSLVAIHPLSLYLTSFQLLGKGMH